MAERIYSVTQLTLSIRRNLLANNAKLAGVWIEGEVSGNKVYASGHRYFTLKDKDAAISCVLFAFNLRTCDEDFKKALACVAAVKGETEGKAEILIECHGRFDVPTALRICHALEEFDPYWVEEPVIPDTMRALADVRSRVRVPIACGERLYTTQQILDAIELRACDYLQPDASHAGGITAMKGIAAICDAHHVPFCAHNPSGPVANAVTLALGVSTPGYCIHETLFDDVPWRREVIDEDVKFVDGYMYVNDRPGLGIELDEKAAAAHPYEPHWLRHYVGTLTNVRPPDSCAYYHA